MKQLNKITGERTISPTKIFLSVSMSFLGESQEKLLPNAQKNKLQPHQPNKIPTQHIDLKKEYKTKARQKKIYKEQICISSYRPLFIFSKSITTAKNKAQNQFLFSLYLIQKRISSSNQSK
jgi:hypothetical protein